LFPYSESEIKVNKDGEEYFDTQYKYDLIPECGKIKTLLEDLEEVPESTHIIVWGRFRGEIDMLEEVLNNAGYSSKKYYGGSEDSVIAEFKRKEFRVLVASTLKGGEGLNLQVSTLHYFYSNSFKADSRLQAEDRSHRIGQTNKVLYKDLLCKGTIDEHIYGVLKRKEDLINYFREKSVEDILN
jgi:SWI/SNF-related matrix-associated actin-dependent regulator 1 of chromatin subfamily A